MKKSILLLAGAASALLLLNSCVAKIPEGAKAVDNFDVEKYAGKWYEIARMDYSFERGLSNATANYSITEKGTVKVENKGYKDSTGEWKTATGEAKFVGSPYQARLKVSFFKPVWAGYNVIALEDYKYSLVAGNNLKYLWILSREKTIPDDVKQRFLKISSDLGYDTSKLIWPKHDRD